VCVYVCFVMCVCVCVSVCMCEFCNVCVCVGVCMCGCFENCVGVLVICVIVFTVFFNICAGFCIVPFIYIYSYLFCLY
jgi:hypothetical protein